ncbi:porin [Roseovarius spongiae]|nr:porin [Roseovarius spongiae]
MNRIVGQAITGAVCGGALIALAAAPPVRAAEFRMEWGGYMEQHLAYASYDAPTAKGFDGADGVGAMMLFFEPSLTFGAATRAGASVRLDGFYGETNSRFAFERAALYAEGAFGRLEIGKLDTPGNSLHAGAPAPFGPMVGIAHISDSALASFLPYAGVHNNRLVGSDVRRGTLGATRVANSGAETHGRIRYFTPRMGGIRFGASYAPESPKDAPNRADFIDLGVDYRLATASGVDLHASGKWGVADNTAAPGADPGYYGAGLSIGYGGFTLGGSYSESHGSAQGVSDGRAYELGARYQRGRYGISLAYLNGENTDDENAAFGAKERLEAVTLGVNYDLFGAPGKRRRDPAPDSAPARADFGGDLFGYVSYARFREDMGDGGAGTPGDDIDGFVIGTGFRLSF